MATCDADISKREIKLFSIFFNFEMLTFFDSGLLRLLAHTAALPSFTSCSPEELVSGVHDSTAAHRCTAQRSQALLMRLMRYFMAHRLSVNPLNLRRHPSRACHQLRVL
jgi:hypothetical protein